MPKANTRLLFAEGAEFTEWKTDAFTNQATMAGQIPTVFTSNLFWKIFQISAIQEAFAYFDTNKDGLISFHEFRQILVSFGESVSDNEIGDRIKMWDGDGDGKINFAEFLVAMAQILTDTENEERMRDAFRIFDKVN